MNQPADVTTRRQQLFAARQALPPLRYSHAEGSWIVLDDGRRILDAASGLVCVNVGHARPSIVRAIAEQSARCTFASPGALEPVLQEQFARRAAAAIGRPDDQVLLTSTGTAAIEMAIMVARAIQRSRGETGRHRILTSTLSYHGNSAVALGLSGHRRRRPHPHDGGGLAPAFDPPFPGLHTLCRYDACRAECVEDVARAIDEAGPDRVAAVLIEPINGTTGGGYVPPDGYLAALRAACEARGVLVIHDEVLTGLCRTGRPLAADHWAGAQADLTVVSKGLGAGYVPIAGLFIAPHLAEQMLSAGAPLPVMGTMSATPLQAAVGIQVLDTLAELDALRPDVTRGEQAGVRLKEAVSSLPAVADVRGRGYFYGVELTGGVLLDVLATGRRNGLLLYPFNGFHADGTGEGVIVAPPLNTSSGEWDFLLAGLRTTLQAVAG